MAASMATSSILSSKLFDNHHHSSSFHGQPLSVTISTTATKIKPIKASQISVVTKFPSILRSKPPQISLCFLCWAMSSGSAESEVVDQLRSRFFPILIGLMGPSPDSEPDRVVLVNPVTQGMIVLRGDAAMLAEIMSAGGGGGGGVPPASKASIEAMRSVDSSELAGGQEGEDGEECSVCLDGLKKEEGDGGVEAVKEMPCRHRFHGGCIEKWLRMHGSCPVCRYQMPIEEKEGGKKEGEGEAEGEGGGRRREVWVTITVSGRGDDEEQQTADTSDGGIGGESEGGGDGGDDEHMGV